MSHVHGAHTAAPDSPVNFVGANTLLLVAGQCGNARFPKAGGRKQLFRRTKGRAS